MLLPAVLQGVCRSGIRCQWNDVRSLAGVSAAAHAVIFLVAGTGCGRALMINIAIAGICAAHARETIGIPGPFLPFAWYVGCCGAARRTGRSLRLQYLCARELVVCGTKRAFLRRWPIAGLSPRNHNVRDMRKTQYSAIEAIFQPREEGLDSAVNSALRQT